jgi:predicted transcriptional regulator
MVDRQCTLGELDGIRTVKGLSENQRKTISLVNCGLTQSQVADKLGFSRAYVNQIIKKLLSFGLIQRIETHPSSEGKRDYTHFYELSPQLKSQISKDGIKEVYSACRVHNIIIKFPILSKSGEPSIDKRASWSKNWKMRGWMANEYWYAGKAGLPHVSIVCNPKSLMVYMCKGQKITAKSDAEAKEMARVACYQAKDKFIEQQSRFGIQFDIAHTGEYVGKVHGGFAIGEAVAKGGITTPGWWIDQSKTQEMSYAEAETNIPGAMTRLDNVIKISEQVDLIHLPEMFKDIVNPIAANVLQVQAMMQGSITNQQMLENVTKLISSVLVEMQAIRQENMELKAKLGMI